MRSEFISKRAINKEIFRSFFLTCCLMLCRKMVAESSCMTPGPSTQTLCTGPEDSLFWIPCYSGTGIFFILLCLCKHFSFPLKYPLSLTQGVLFSAPTAFMELGFKLFVYISFMIVSSLKAEPCLSHLNSTKVL